MPLARNARLMVFALLACTSGCGRSARLDTPLSEFEARLREDVGPGARLVRSEADRLDIRLTEPRAHRMRWRADGSQLAIAQSDQVQILDLDGSSRIRVLPTLGEAPPALYWLDDGRLWVHPGGGPLLEVSESGWTVRPTPDGALVDVSGDGRLLLRSGNTLALAEQAGEAWRAVERFSIPKEGPYGAGFAAAGPAYGTAHGLHERAADGPLARYHRWPEPSGVSRFTPRRLWLDGPHICALSDRSRVLLRSGGQALELARSPAPADQITQGCAGPEAAVLGITPGRGAWIEIDGRSRVLDPHARAVTLDPTGRLLAISRADGVYVRRLDDPEVITRAPVDVRTFDGVALGEGDATWVVGLPPEAVSHLPQLDGVGPLEGEVQPGGFSGHYGLRVGWRSDTGAPVAELIGRVAPYAFGWEPEEGRPGVQHLIMPALQLGADFTIGPGALSDPGVRLGLPLVYRRRRIVRYAGQRYTTGLPLTVTLEPAWHILREQFDLGLSVSSEQYGGIYGRIGLGPDGIQTTELGIELGRTPTQLVAGAALVVAIIVAIAEADVGDGFCYRCGPMWGDDP